MQKLLRVLAIKPIDAVGVRVFALKVEVHVTLAHHFLKGRCNDLGGDQLGAIR